MAPRKKTAKSETCKRPIEQYDRKGKKRETISPVGLPFALGEHERIAVKVIDDRGIESLKVVSLV